MIEPQVSLRLKRVYEPPEPSDGKRILVDRLWPRGLSKREGAVDAWMKEIAPSTKLRRWFRHDPARWAEFKRRNRREFRANRFLVREVAELASLRRVTLVYPARDETHNDARVLATLVRTYVKRAALAKHPVRER